MAMERGHLERQPWSLGLACFYLILSGGRLGPGPRTLTPETFTGRTLGRGLKGPPRQTPESQARQGRDPSWHLPSEFPGPSAEECRRCARVYAEGIFIRKRSKKV